MESFRSSSISPKCTSHLGIGLDAARVRARSFEEGRRAGLAEAQLAWDELAAVPGLHPFMDHVRGAED